jgi:hypothetical protein
MLADGHTWDLVFDPSTEAEKLRTDEMGRVWRQIATNPLNDLPF